MAPIRADRNHRIGIEVVACPPFAVEVGRRIARGHVQHAVGFIASNCLNECGDDLVPTEGWGDRSQNCLHHVRIIGNTQLIWNGQQ